MAGYVIKRLFLAVPTFLAITFVSFLLIHLAPGDPATSTISSESDGHLSPAVCQELRQRYHFDRPIPLRYLAWLGELWRLDLGRSFDDGRPVVSKIVERLPATAVPALVSIVLALLVAVPLGVECARRPGAWLDRIVGVAAYGLYAVPRYVMAMVLIVIVGVQWGWLPFVGLSSDDYATRTLPARLADLVSHGALLVVCLTYPLAAFQVRLVRNAMLTVFGEDYIRTARAKGLSEWQVAYRHALPNALLPLLTLMGVILPALLGGSVVLEVVFSWPGLGRLMFEAVTHRDYPVAMALSVVSAVLVLAGTLLVDVLYAAVDPRVRYS